MRDGSVHLIRHSISTGTERRWLYGQTDLPLAESGLRLLDALCAAGIYPPAEGRLLVSSGMLRADQTLRAIYGDVPFAVDAGLREMNLGAYECKTDAELQSDPAYRRWVADPTGDMPAPGGESVNGFADRVNAAFDRLLLRADRDIIAVCHGGVIASILFRHLRENGSFYTWLPAPARGFTLAVRSGRIDGVSPITEQKEVQI